MTKSTVQVSVYEGSTFLQHWTCTRTSLTDGTAAAIWRGMVYPILDGERIDVAAPAEIHPQVPPAPPMPPPSVLRHALIAGEASSWVLVQGQADALRRARQALQAVGVAVSRTGRWLGDALDQTAFDWFICCDGRLDAADVGAWLGGGEAIDAGRDARQMFMEQQAAELHGHAMRLQEMLHDAGQQKATVASTQAALADAVSQIAALQLRLDAAAAVAPADAILPVVTPPPAATMRLHAELATALAAFRPDILLLRDSMIVAAGEFRSRDGFWRAVQQLPPSGARPDGWKALKGAARGWERHVSNGQDNTGRAYARFDTAGRIWQLLLSWKASQPGDIAWITRQG